jgi:hypothetical protein
MSKPWTALAPIRAIVRGGRVMALGERYTGSEQGFGGNEPWPDDDPEAPRSPTRLLDSLLRLEQADLQAWVHGLAQARSRHGHPWYHELDYANTDTLLSHLAACLDAAHLARFTRMAIRDQDLPRWSEHLARSASDSDRLDLLIALVDRGTSGEIVPPSHPEPCALCAPLVGRLLASLHGRTHALDTALQAMVSLPRASAQSVAMVRAMLAALLPPCSPGRTHADPGALRKALEACATASDAPAKATLWALAIPVAAQGAALAALAPAFTRMLTSQTCAIVNALAQQHPDGQALARYLNTLRAQQRSHEIRLIHHQLHQGDGGYPPEEYLHHRDRRGAYPHATALGYYLGAWAVATGSTLSGPPAGTTGPLHPLTQPIGRTPQVAHQGDLWLAGSAYAALGPAQSADEDKLLTAPVWQRGGSKAAFWAAYQCVLQAHCVGLSPLLLAASTPTRGGTEPGIGGPYEF